MKIRNKLAVLVAIITLFTSNLLFAVDMCANCDSCCQSCWGYYNSCSSCENSCTYCEPTYRSCARPCCPDMHTCGCNYGDYSY